MIYAQPLAFRSLRGSPALLLCSALHAHGQSVFAAASRESYIPLASGEVDGLANSVGLREVLAAQTGVPGCHPITELRMASYVAVVWRTG